MEEKDYLIYRGEEYQIEWYFDHQNRSDARDYFEALPHKRQDKALALFALMGCQGRIRDITKFRNEGDGVYVFKPQPDRFFCFFVKGKKIIVVNAYEKKGQKLNPGEKKRAVDRKKDYEERNKKDEYY